jgi:hypothetical protein
MLLPALLLFVLIADFTISARTVSFSKMLPRKIILGYCNWSQADEQVLTAVRNGVNVIVWFSVNISKNKEGKCVIDGAVPDLDKVAALATTMREEGKEVTHLMSIGGWNSPHPDTAFSSKVMFETLDKWNKHTASTNDWPGFDGFDWDVEGNDDFDSPHNEFSVQCLDTMGELSQLLKRGGYVVAMAPAESYLDPTTNEFSRSLRHNHPEWEHVQPSFFYRGRNTYAYLLSRYGRTTIDGDRSSGDGGCVDTFDFVTLQLYEGFSHGKWKIRYADERDDRMSPAAYVHGLVQSMQRGWHVDFSSEPSVGYASHTVAVPAAKLVIGLANGWAGEPENKFLFLDAKELAEVHAKLAGDDATAGIRGYAYWNIKDEGEKGINMASTLAALVRDKD